MLMKYVSGLTGSGVLIAIALHSCSGGGPNVSNVNFQLSAPHYASNSALGLPEDYCFAVHVTGEHPGLQRIPRLSAEQMQSCPNSPPTVGLLRGFVAKGESLELQVPIGPARRFDLIGVSKADLGGVCPTDLRAEPKPGQTMDTKVDVFAGGKTLAESVQLKIFAKGTADLRPGDNTVALTAVLDNGNIGATYSGCSSQSGSNIETFPWIENGIMKVGEFPTPLAVRCEVGVAYVEIDAGLVGGPITAQCPPLEPTGFALFQNFTLGLSPNQISGPILARRFTNAGIKDSRTFQIQRAPSYKFLKDTSNVEFVGTPAGTAKIRLSGRIGNDLYVSYLDNTATAGLKKLPLDPLGHVVISAPIYKAVGAGEVMVQSSLGEYGGVMRILSSTAGAIARLVASDPFGGTDLVFDATPPISGTGSAMTSMAQDNGLFVISGAGNTYHNYYALGGPGLQTSWNGATSSTLTSLDVLAPPLQNAFVAGVYNSSGYYVSLKRCLTKAHCATTSPTQQFDTVVSSSITSLQQLQVALREFALNQSLVYVLRSQTVNSVSLVMYQTGGSVGSTTLTDITGAVNPQFYPAWSGNTVDIRFIKSFKNDPNYAHMMFAGGNFYDGSPTNGYKAVLYRSVDGGKNWYRVWMSAGGGSDHYFEDAVVIEQNINGFTRKAIAAVLRDQGTAYRILVQDGSGF